MFHLRDEMANQMFGGRVKDVFANLGTGLVKHDDDADEDSKNEDKIKSELTIIGDKTKHKNKRAKYEDRKIPNIPSEPKSVKGDEGPSRSIEKEPEYEPFKRPNSFKKPDKFKPRGKSVPDHRKHPDKWTKYSLADVSPDDMSDRSNTKAALQFLNKLKEDKAGEKEEPADLTQKVVFKKREKREEKEEEPEGEKKFSGNVRVMPQAEIGRKKSKVSKTSGKGKTNEVSLKLSHLDEDEDCDD